MAILDKVSGLEACILVDGVPLQEYPDDEEEIVEESDAAQYRASRTVTNYVESASNKEYAIGIKLDTKFRFDCPSLQVYVKVDGKVVRQPLLQRSDYKDQNLQCIISGVPVGQLNSGGRQLLKKFKFSEIELTTDDSKLQDIKKDSKDMNLIGEITIEVYRASESKADSPPSNVGGEGASSKAKKVHEKALKGQAKSHNTCFAPPSDFHPISYYTCELLDGKEFPDAVFRFKYRSREALKSLLIIERTPTPDPEAASDNPLSLDNLDADQKRQLEQFLRGLTGNRNASNTPSRTIKRERDNTNGESSRKKRRSAEKVCIDLTGDSDSESVVTLD